MFNSIKQSVDTLNILLDYCNITTTKKQFNKDINNSLQHLYYFVKIFCVLFFVIKIFDSFL